MNRIFTALGWMACAGLLSAQDEPQPANIDPPQLNPAPVPEVVARGFAKSPGPSLVAVSRAAEALDGFEENPAVTRRMVDSLVKTATGRATVADAWRSLAGPSDRVGIKVTATGGRLFSTRRGVVAAVVAGLKIAGVPESNIFVWDRDITALKEAGFTPERLGCDVRGINQPKDWDKEGSLAAPALGQLIWGDLQFAERVVALNKNDGDQLSSKSHLCKILTHEATKWINIPGLSDAPGVGVHGAMYSAVIGNIDNWRRFTTDGADAATALPDMYADERIGGKCVLHILDALAVTYAGGPWANPNLSATPATLYASKDPIALDAVGARLLDQWRTAANLPVLGTKSAWLQSAGAVGNFEESKIRFITAK